MSQQPTGITTFLPFKDFFALDVRSLALFRILLATLLLLDWLDRIPDVPGLYTDDGTLPRSLLTMPVTFSSFSIHMFSGEAWYQYLLAGVGVLLSLGLLVGYQTPLMCFLSFLMLISIHGRNPAVMHGGDHLIRAVLFWGIFLPLGARMSVDSLSGKPGPNVVRSLASFALIMQIVIVYLFAAVWKWDERWRDQGSAVYITLTNECFTTRIGYLLRSQPWLCKWLTHLTVVLETLGPVLLFLPFHVGLQRLIAIALFVGFHAGLGLCMELANFPFVGMMIWSALIPPSFWDRIGPRLPWFASWGPGSPPDDTAKKPAWAPPSGPVPTTVLALCFVYVVFFNIHGYLWLKGKLTNETLTFLPPQFLHPGIVGGLEQGWGLFAPRPTPLAGWHLAIGVKEDGTEFEMLRGSSPPDHSKPVLQSTTYWNGRWRKVLQGIGQSGGDFLAAGYTRWLLLDWNRRHPPGERVVKVTMIYVKQATYGPDEPVPPAEEIVMGSYAAGEGER